MIEYYLNHVNAYLQAHAYLGGLFAFLVSFAESLPLIGTLIPGSITMSVIGILVGRGMLGFESTLWWSTVGALAGDTIGFWIGKIYNERLRDVWPFKKHPTWLSLGESFFQKHGGKSILIGRFVGPARSSVPLIAGLLKMQWGRFLIAAIPSAVLWAIAYILPGVLIGAISLELPRGATTKFMIIGLGMIIVVWLIFWAIQRFFVFIVSFINRLIDQLWAWLNRHHSSKFLIRLITNRLNPTDHNQLTLVMLAFFCLILFLTTLTLVLIFGSNNAFNHPVFYFLQSIRTHHGNQFFIIMTTLGDKHVIFCIACLVTLGLLIKKQWRAAFHLIFITLAAFASVHFFKHLIASPRPTMPLAGQLSYSFPSGHTALSLMILGFISFLLAQQLPKKWHWVPHTTTSLLVMLIALSRLYLGAHWLTDILGAIFLAFSILLIVIVAYRRYAAPPFSQLVAILFVMTAVAIPWVSFGVLKFKIIMSQYEPYRPVQLVSMNEWWRQPLQYLPIYRLDRFGRPIQPLNIQWAASLENIKKSLTNDGWVIVEDKSDMKNTLHHFTSHQPEKHASLFAQLHRFKPPVLFMMKKLPHSSAIIELHLWQSGLEFYGKFLPLWIGSFNYHIPPRHLISLKKGREFLFNGDGGANVLLKSARAHEYQIKFIQTPVDNQPKQVKALRWNGKIIILRATLSTINSTQESH